eukprot:7958414-Pyramimonas_sp.AAC.1
MGVDLNMSEDTGMVYSHGHGHGHGHAYAYTDTHVKIVQPAWTADSVYLFRCCKLGFAISVVRFAMCTTCAVQPKWCNLCGTTYVEAAV